MWGLISTIIIGVVTGVIVYVLQLKIKENKELQKEKERLEKEKEENEKKRKTQHEMAIENGIVCILRKHLMDEHTCWMAKGYITSTALESGLAMYGAYKMLGGNGMIDHMKEDIETLPIRD